MELVVALSPEEPAVAVGAVAVLAPPSLEVLLVVVT